MGTNTPEMKEALKHCVRVMRSCRTLEQLNMTHNWAVGVICRSQPCENLLRRVLGRIFPGFAAMMRAQRTVRNVQRLIRLRNHFSRRIVL